MDYLSQPMMQQYMQPQYQRPAYQQAPGILGRPISMPTDIMPGDIPMNGQPCFFPMADGSAIYRKAWQPDGTISTTMYVPAQREPSQPSQLDRIESMLTRFLDKEAEDE